MNGTERGMALGVALIALTVVGALVAASLFVGVQEQRVGDNQRRVNQAFGVAEAGLMELTSGPQWNSLQYNAMRYYPFDTATFAWTTAPGGTGQYSGSVVRLGDNLYFAAVTASDRVTRAGAALGAGARQRLGLVMRHCDKCMTGDSLQGSAGPTPLRSRGWVQLIQWP